MEKLTILQRRKIMQAVKAKGSKIETVLAKELFARGYRYRRNDKTVFGKPDISFKKIKVAIFADSEFWHGKDWEKRQHDFKSNISFWKRKIERNIQRDIEVNSKLLNEGWTILRFWGKDITEDLIHCIEIIEDTIKGKMFTESNNNKTFKNEF